MGHHTVCVVVGLVAHMETLVSSPGTGSTWCTWKKNLESLFHIGTGLKMRMYHPSGRESEPLFRRAHLAPRAENAKIDVKVIGASQEMCNYLPLLQKLPAALVIRKVKVTKHSSRVSLREIFT